MSMFIRLQEYDEDSANKQASSIIVAGKAFQTSISPLEGYDIYIKAVEKIVGNMLAMKAQYAQDKRFDAISAELYNNTRAILETFIQGVHIDDTDMQRYVKLLAETMHFMLENLDLFFITGKDEYAEKVEHFANKIRTLFADFRASISS